MEGSNNKTLSFLIKSILQGNLHQPNLGNQPLLSWDLTIDYLVIPPTYGAIRRVINHPVVRKRVARKVVKKEILEFVASRNELKVAKLEIDSV